MLSGFRKSDNFWYATSFRMLIVLFCNFEPPCLNFVRFISVSLQTNTSHFPKLQLSSNGRSPSHRIIVQSLLPTTAVSRTYGQGALRSERHGPVQVERDELVLVLYARRIVVEALRGQVLVANHVRRRGNGVRRGVSRHLPHASLLELVADRGRRGEIVEVGEVLQGVGWRVLSVQTARGLVDGVVPVEEPVTKYRTSLLLYISVFCAKDGQEGVSSRSVKLSTS